MAVFGYLIISAVVNGYCLGQYTLTKSEKYVFPGSSITFTCNAGTVVNSVLWITPGLIFPVSQGSGTSCTGTPPPDYQYSCSGGTVFSLTINNINFCYNGTEWKCGPPFGGTPSNTERIEVHVPLEKVSITRDSPSVKPGILTEINCSTNPCHPEAVITWTLDGTKITDGITSSTEFINCSGIVTTSHLNEKFNIEDNGKRLVCSATNGDYHVSSSITFDNQELTTRETTKSITLEEQSGSSSAVGSVTVTVVIVIFVLFLRRRG